MSTDKSRSFARNRRFTVANPLPLEEMSNPMHLETGLPSRKMLDIPFFFCISIFNFSPPFVLFWCVYPKYSNRLLQLLPLFHHFPLIIAVNLIHCTVKKNKIHISHRQRQNRRKILDLAVFELRNSVQLVIKGLLGNSELD